jgi:hypothetical protein
MKIYARIDNGMVAELLATDGNIAAMFNPAILWIDVTSQQEIAEGWSFDGANFAPPPAPPPAPAPAAPTIADMQARIATLAAQLAALSTSAKP